MSSLSQTVTELKAELESQGLSKVGRKADLVKRLLQHEAGEEVVVTVVHCVTVC
jgi:hypothetical protein